MSNILENDMETKKKRFGVPILFVILFILSCVPYNVTHYFVQGKGFNYFYADIVSPFCGILTIVFFYPLVNFFDKVIHLSSAGIAYVVIGIILYGFLGYVLELFFRKIGIKNIIVRIILGLLFLPISGLIYMPFGPSLF